MARIVKKAAQRREEIVEASCQLFLSKGYDKTTISDVMNSLNVAKGTIYHYFKSKEELLDAVIESIVLADKVEKLALVKSCEGRAMDKLKPLILSNKKGEEQKAIAECLHQSANAGMHVRLLARMITVQAPIYAELIEQGCKEGIFTTDHPLESAEFILVGFRLLTDVGIYPWSEEQLTRRALTLPGLIEAQLKAPVGSFEFILELLQ